MNASLTAQFVDDLHSSASADTVRARSDHCGHIGGPANASRGLHAGTVAYPAPHQRDIVRGCAASEPSGGSLYEIRAAEQREFARQDLFFHREQAGFDDDFQHSYAPVRDLCDSADIQLHAVAVARLE